MITGPTTDSPERFAQGFERFRDRIFKLPNSPYEKLRDGQQPQAIIIACSDSRVSPTTLLQVDPGEIFVVRNVANLVPPADSADDSIGSALHYAVSHLGTPNVIVFGHSGCGGIRALLDGADALDDSVGRWLSQAAPVRDAIRGSGLAPEAEPCACEQASIVRSLANLLSYSCVREKMAAGQLALRGWYFDISRGELWECLPPGTEFTRRVPAGM